MNQAKGNKGKNGKGSSQLVHSKVKPVVVKHVLTQNFIQKPEIYQSRPVKQVSVQSQMPSGYKQSPGGYKQQALPGARTLNVPAYAPQSASTFPTGNTYQPMDQGAGVGAGAAQQALVNRLGMGMNLQNQDSGPTFNQGYRGDQSNSAASASMLPQYGIQTGHPAGFGAGGQPSGPYPPSGMFGGAGPQQQMMGAGLSGLLPQAPGGRAVHPLQQFNPMSASKQSSGYSDVSQSPRFYGKDQAQYGTYSLTKPEEVCRDLIQAAQNGMQGLQKFAARENLDPNTKIVRMTDPTTGIRRLEHQALATNFEAQSIRSDVTYKWSAIGEMSNDELDQLRAKNEARIQEIEGRYFEANQSILTAKEIMRQQKENFETKEKFRDASINYPTYGRGLAPPGVKLNTFIVQDCMFADSAKKKRQTSGSGSPQPDVQAQQRKRILSPRRQRFETHFEAYVSKKLVDDKLVEAPAPSTDFDTTTKPEGTLNAKVNEKLKWEAEQKVKVSQSQVLKSLNTLEVDAERILHEEVVVIMGKEMLNKLKEVFDSCKERGQEDDEVEMNELIASIAEDPYFEKCLDQDVRESVDGVRESLESLLHRVITSHKQEAIEWFAFLGFFTKRGQLRDNEKLNLKLNKKPRKSGAELGADDAGAASSEEEEDYDSKRHRLERNRDKLLVRKQNLVPKTGKGKFNVTVPVPFEFLNQEKGFSIRQRKVEQMVYEKIKEEERALAYEYRARDVPKSVKEQKYQKLTKANEERRAEAKRLAMAKIKATEAPFKFYERDLKAQKEKGERAELPAHISDNAPFRAGKIPWRVLVPRYKRMVDDEEAAREKRVKKNAEVSLSLAKLPPRMEAHARQRQDGGKLGARSNSVGPQFSFKPAAPRDVPDFKRLHQEFAAQLERNKGGSILTTPKPFNFHEPKNDPSLRKHMDDDNQIINPTKKPRRARSQSLNRDLAEEQRAAPPTTKKHEAMVAMRRENQTGKIQKKIEVQAEDHVRAIKQVRLTNRVKQSPALANNAIELKKRRTNGLQRGKDQMRYLESVYDQRKAIMEFNVANRPLLVEQQTQEFINLYNQIRDLQKYVAILRNANMDPNDHLTEDQKILLQRAQYFDQLNQLAYFPGGIPPPAGQEGGVNVLDEQQQQQLLLLQQQNMSMPVDQQMLQQDDQQQQQQYLPEDHYERVGVQGQMGGVQGVPPGYQARNQMQMEGDEDASASPEQVQQQQHQLRSGAMQDQLGQYMAAQDAEGEDEEIDEEDGGEEDMEGEEEGEADEAHQLQNQQYIGSNEPEIVNEMQAMDMERHQDQLEEGDDDGEMEDDSEGDGQHQQQVDIDGQGEHQIVDEDGDDGEELDEEDEDQEGEQQDYIDEGVRDRMGHQGQSPPLDEDGDGQDYGEEHGEDNDGVAEADQQVQQVMHAGAGRNADDDGQDEDDDEDVDAMGGHGMARGNRMMQHEDDEGQLAEGDEGEGDEGEGDYGLAGTDEEQYAQFMMHMQQDGHNMLIDQQDGDIDPRNLDPQQLQRLHELQQMQQWEQMQHMNQLQQMYGDEEEFEGEGEGEEVEEGEEGDQQYE